MSLINLLSPVAVDVRAWSSLELSTIEAKVLYLTKMVKSARKSETETFGIVGRFHRFEDVAPTSVHWVNVRTSLYSTYRKKKTCSFNSELTQNRQEQAWRMKYLLTEIWDYLGIIVSDRNKVNEYKS